MSFIDANTLVKDMLNTLLNKPSLAIKELNPEETALVIVDMVNGFTREGAMQSDRMVKLIPKVADLLVRCQNLNIPVIAFVDCHPVNSPEFIPYPPHCLDGSNESELVKELVDIGGYIRIPKNSTNGFLEEAFQKWLASNPQITTFIVVGGCTDICVEQFSNTLKAYFNQKNLFSRIIVPMDGVDTFGTPMHPGDVFQIVSLQIMSGNGIEIVTTIE